MKRLLCVGGYFDGDRFDVDDGCISLMLEEPVSVLSPAIVCNPGVKVVRLHTTVKAQQYLALRIYSTEVLVCDQMTPDEAISKLIKGYKKEDL